MLDEKKDAGVKDKPRDAAGKIKEIGGLVAVVVGVLGVAAVAGGALIAGGETAATIAGSTSAVIGSMVGAFFGVKIGTDQTKDAVQGERAEAAKAQIFAAHLPEGKADVVVQEVREAVKASAGVR